MEYKFSPFEPTISNADPTGSATKALALEVSKQAKDGWEFVSIQNHSTVVPGNGGCFGIGATSPYPKTVSIITFKK